MACGATLHERCCAGNTLPGTCEAVTATGPTGSGSVIGLVVERPKTANARHLPPRLLNGRGRAPRYLLPRFTTTEGTETSGTEPTFDVRVGAHALLHLDGDTGSGGTWETMAKDVQDA